MIDGIGDISLRNQARIHHYDSAGELLKAFREVIIQREAKDRTKRSTVEEKWNPRRYRNKSEFGVSAKQQDRQRAAETRNRKQKQK